AMVHVIKQRYQPVTEPLRTDLLDIANNQLRPRPARPSTLVDATQNRLDFRTAIDHRRGGNHGETLAI
ncbi:MAG: hypothetical protein LC679_02260, partial [Intrasporangiaceae bacterium]|nr:hypothetical protein [Intrasporangiaceae bacterium]